MGGVQHKSCADVGRGVGYRDVSTVQRAAFNKGIQFIHRWFKVVRSYICCVFVCNHREMIIFCVNVSKPIRCKHVHTIE